MRASVNAVERGGVPHQLVLHAPMDVIQRGLRHQAFAHALLAGDENRGKPARFAQRQRRDGAGREMKIFRTQHIAVSGRDIDDSITIKKNSGAGRVGGRHVHHA